MVRTRPRVLLVTMLLVVSTVDWRRGQYFSGSLDPVVVAKAVLSVLALVLAFHAAQTMPRRRLGTGSMWPLALVLACSVFGALTYGTLLASGVVAIRVAIVGLTVFFLLRTATVYEAFSGVAFASGVVGFLATATGLSTVTSGRLSGGLPPLDPNGLALLASIVVLFVAWRVVLGEASWLRTVAAIVSIGIIWLSGSRTALVMLLIAVAVMALFIRRARVGLVTGALVAAAAASVMVFTTSAATSFAERNGTGTSTLDSRFIAWRAAAAWAESPWQLAFGGGLSVKIIQVHAQWWNQQPLDSSWVSALVQCGLVGLILCIGWSLWVLRGAFRAPRPYRVLFVGVAVFMIGRGLLESGLFDATPSFIAFFAVSLLGEGGSRARLREELRAAPVPTTGRRSGEPLPAGLPGVP